MRVGEPIQGYFNQETVRWSGAPSRSKAPLVRDRLRLAFGLIAGTAAILALVGWPVTRETAVPGPRALNWSLLFAVSAFILISRARMGFVRRRDTEYALSDRSAIILNCDRPPSCLALDTSRPAQVRRHNFAYVLDIPTAQMEPGEPEEIRFSDLSLETAAEGAAVFAERSKTEGLRKDGQA